MIYTYNCNLKSYRNEILYKEQIYKIIFKFHTCRQNSIILI
jgi:hypothetical protein